jgi:hypothetical protein
MSKRPFLETFNMKRLAYFVGGSFLVYTLGCKTNVPMVGHHPGTFQTKVQAAEHWQLMSRELAGRIAGNPNVTGKSVYLEVRGPQTPFAEAYYNLLITELTARSMKVALAPAESAAVQLTITTQLIRHGDREFWANPATLFGAIGYGFRNIFVGDSTGSDRATSEELIVTSWLRANGTLELASSQIVYVSPQDAHLYRPETSPFAEWQSAEARARASAFAQ